METLRTFVRNLGPVRTAVLGGVALVLAGFFAWMIARAAEPPMALLYGELDMAEAGKITAQLDAARIPYQLGAGGTTVMVPADRVARTRMALAEQGLPSGGSVGYEIFDGANALGTTNFQQNVNLVRALEGELSRSIRSIGEVKTARVHLVLPQRELFSRDKPQASASVLLQMRGRNRLTPAQVAAIQQLVASAVPALAIDRISVVDGQGTLLSEGSGGGDPVAGAAAKADQRRRTLENHLARTIEQLVERTVGPGKVRAEVSADMDFDRIDSSEEIFDPDGQVVRSTQTVDQSGSNRQGASQPVSVSTNLPDTEARPATETSEISAEKRSEETVNYEISKKVVNHVREAGTVQATCRSPSWSTASGPPTHRARRPISRAAPTSCSSSPNWYAAPSATTPSAATRSRSSACASRNLSRRKRRPPPSCWAWRRRTFSGSANTWPCWCSAASPCCWWSGRSSPRRWRPCRCRPIAPQTARLAGARQCTGAARPGRAAAPPSGSVPDRLEEMIDVNRVEGRVKASPCKPRRRDRRKASRRIPGDRPQLAARRAVSAPRCHEPTMTPRKMSGAEKAAIFLLALGEAHAGKLMRMMDDDEIRTLSQTDGASRHHQRPVGRGAARRLRRVHLQHRRARRHLRVDRAAAVEDPRRRPRPADHGGDPRPRRAGRCGTSSATSTRRCSPTT